MAVRQHSDAGCSDGSAGSGLGAASGQDPDLMVLERIALLYPDLYSRKQLLQWRDLFHDQAVVIRLAADGKPRVQSIDSAMPEQIDYAAANRIFLETWQHVEIRVHGNTASISADYRLEADSETRHGIDLLTLTKIAKPANPSDIGSWKIISLIYEEVDCVVDHS